MEASKKTVGETGEILRPYVEPIIDEGLKQRLCKLNSVEIQNVLRFLSHKLIGRMCSES